MAALEAGQERPRRHVAAPRRRVRRNQQQAICRMAALSRLNVSFDQPDHGWLKVELRSEQIACSETFSHFYPTLPNLCEALCDVAERREARRVVFLLEPQELE